MSTQERLEKIQASICDIDFITVDMAFALDSDFNVCGKVLLHVNEVTTLPFDVTILPEYPLKRYNAEAIKFSNVELLPYQHVMGNGSICIHTSHHPSLNQKLQIDFNSLLRWAKDYYLGGKKDVHYEHIILQPKEIAGHHHSYFFTDVEYRFSDNEHGFFEYSRMKMGRHGDTPVLNNLIHTFYSKANKELTECQWSDAVMRTTGRQKNIGLFVFLSTPPAIHGRFAYTNWLSFTGAICEESLKFLYGFEKANQKGIGGIIPLLVGYKIDDIEIHWQVVMLEIGRFPFGAEKVNQKWQGSILESQVNWGITRNCSYKYFFGRGGLCDRLTNGRILIVGIGAIGSILATSLVRGGCRKIDFVDHDVKEPENVCRSEYSFDTGINNKVDDLANHLYAISPFVEIGILEESFFNLYLKALLQVSDAAKDLRNHLKQYELIFDCSTDNDLLYVLSDLEIDNLVTLSITNKANALICSAEPQSYYWVINQFENVLENDIEDLYNPTGCWSPTFKASYNDVNVLVQQALKIINSKLGKSDTLKNFVLQTENDMTIKYLEF